MLLDLWSKEQTYDVAGQLGYVEYHLKNYGASARYTAFSLAHLPPHETMETQQRLRMAMDDLRARVGTLHVIVSEPGAEVRTDDVVFGTSPLPGDVYLDPGNYQIEARTSDDRIARQPVVVSAGATYDVQLMFSPPPSAAPPATTAPPPEAPPPTNTARVVDPAPPPQSIPDAEPGSKSMVPVYVGGAVTAIGVGMWIGFGVDAKNARDEATTLQHGLGANGMECTGSAISSQCRRLQDTVDRQHRDATLAKVGIAVTAVGGVATLAYVLFWPSHRTEATATARSTFRASPDVMLGQRGGSLIVTGEF
ncbi:MAG TPA: hypothetical protein VHC69_18460 [Polyangiaceae bacterium]|nr:hypothetical protein [Polyangiaceae bacterium]